MTAPQRLPEFVIIGAAKSGTTSLHAILDQHDGLFMPEIKEPEFFARDDLYEQGIASYADKFAAARPDQMIGEASTIYTMTQLFPEAPARIKAHIPQAKIIYMMREPVSRAYSFYIQLLKTYQNATGDLTVNRSFEDMIMPERHAKAASRDKMLVGPNAHLPDVPELCLVASEYAAQIEAYLAHFPCEQCLFLKFEDFVEDQRAVLRQITDFIGVAPVDEAIFDNSQSTQNISATHFEEMSETVALRQAQKRAGPLWALRALLPQKLRDALKARMRGSWQEVPRPASMEPATRKMLEDRFAQQIPALEGYTGLSFDNWNLPSGR